MKALAHKPRGLLLILIASEEYILITAGTGEVLWTFELPFENTLNSNSIKFPLHRRISRRLQAYMTDLQPSRSQQPWWHWQSVHYLVVLILKALVKQGQIIATTLLRRAWNRTYASRIFHCYTSILITTQGQRTTLCALKKQCHHPLQPR